MKQIGGFLKSTILGGLFVLLPVILIYLLLSEVMDIAIVFATPIADLFPEGTFDPVSAPALLAITIIVGTSFLLGLLMLSGVGRSVGRWLESKLLDPLPGYRVIKSLTQSLGSASDGEAFKPVLLSSASGGEQEFAYLIEDHGDGRATVMVPWAPTPMAGSVRIVSRDRLQPLDASLADVTRVLGHWGAGAKDLLRPPSA
jgi:uncharacterized membrane protein